MASRRRALAAVAAGAAMFAVAGNASASGSAHIATHYTIAVTVNSASGEYPAAQLAKTKQLCKQDGLTCIVLDPELNAVTQASQVQTAISQGVNAVMYFPVNINTERPTLLKLKAAHIPVLNWGSHVKPGDASLVDTYTGEDSTYEGKAMGQQLCKDAKGKPTQIAVVAGLPGSGATVERTNGFMGAIKSCKNVHVVISEPGNFDQATALSVTADILQAHPTIQAIYSEDDVMGLGVISAVKAAHLTGKIKIYGIGGEKSFVADIKKGLARASIGQDPWSYAEAGISTILKILHGQHVPKFVGIAAPIITKANASSYHAHW